MRPLLVLALVLGALGALIFALWNLPGGDAGRSASGGGGAAAPAVPQPSDPVNVALDDPGPRGAVDDDAPATSSREDVDSATNRHENELTGLVVDTRGEPLQNVSVTLTTATAESVFFGRGPTDERTDRVTRTDKDGRYSFVNVPPFEHYGLILRHADYARKDVSNVSVTELGRSEEPTIKMIVGSTLSGFVQDSSNNPIPGATVRLASVQFVNMEHPHEDELVVRTDTNGRYEIRNISAGGRHLTVTADGYGSVRIPGFNFRGSKEIERDVVLKVAEMLGGRVVGPTNEPIAGATVKAMSFGSSKQTSQSTATTDRNGGFRFEDLRGGTYIVLVDAAGYRPERVQRVETGRLDLLIQLKERATVRGRVVDGETGRPVPSGQVVLRQSYDHSPKTTQTNFRATFANAEGRFEVRGVSPGTYVVEAVAPDFAPTYSVKFTVTDGQSVPGIEVRLTRGGSISGRVLGPDGKPVRGAVVSSHDNDWSDDFLTQIMGQQYPTNCTPREVKTDRDGRFTLPNLKAETYQLRARKDGLCSYVKQGVSVGEGQDRRVEDIRLSRGGFVAGTLFDKSGERLVGGELRLSSDHGPGTLPRQYTRKSNNQGQFLFKNIPPGAYELSATRPGGPTSNPFDAILDLELTRRRVIVRADDTVKQDITIGG